MRVASPADRDRPSRVRDAPTAATPALGLAASFLVAGDADRYRVRVVTGTLQAVLDIDGVTDTLVAVPRDDLRRAREGMAADGPTALLYLQVTARRGTREVRRSELISLSVP